MSFKKNTLFFLDNYKLDI